MDLLPKDLPIKIKLTKNRGMFIMIIPTPLGRPKSICKICDIPPTPPGAMLYGKRNQEYPMAKNTEANTMPK
jgi:hypothetical protein